MNISEAIRILHPDTTREEIQRIREEEGEEAALKKVEEACEVACDALEKQMPKIPVICRTSGGQKGFMCPNCYRLEDVKNVDGLRRFCRFCGQAFDLEEVE